MRLADTVGGDASLYILRTNGKYKLASKKELNKLNRFNQVDSPYNVNGASMYHLEDGEGHMARLTTCDNDVLSRSADYQQWQQLWIAGWQAYSESSQLAMDIFRFAQHMTAWMTEKYPGSSYRSHPAGGLPAAIAAAKDALRAFGKHATDATADHLGHMLRLVGDQAQEAATMLEGGYTEVPGHEMGFIGLRIPCVREVMPAPASERPGRLFQAPGFER